ncbi:MAG: hypothetical protein V3W31_07975 [Thermodesulfobacteriota bacterium]
MKKFFMPVAALAVLLYGVGCGVFNQAEVKSGSEEASVAEAPAAEAALDERAELKLPPAMKLMQKKMMRKHLDTVSEITAALAASELDRAAEVARTNLGWSEEEETKCRKVSRLSGKGEFLILGMAVHKKADELADAAEAGDRDGALKSLAGLIHNCNECHKTFRH